MDLRLFHSGHNPDADYSRKDRFNSYTSRLPCTLLELIGWYNISIRHRLLGHYRLFQLFKAGYSKHSDMPVVQAYILHFRIRYHLKYLLFRVLNLTLIFSYFRNTDDGVLSVTLGKVLVREGAPILHDFLANAETDFETAFLHALKRINSAELFGTSPAIPNTGSNMLVQINDHSTINNSQVIIQPTIKAKEGPHGKEKGVFSKKQVLILFDLLAASARIERLDLSKPNKYDHIAQLMQALTGKGKDTWLEELGKYRNRGLYEFHDNNERSQLINILTNLSDFFRNAGLRSVAAAADKKVKELEVKKLP